MPSELEQFHELCFYTLAHPDPAFLHQNAVDAFAAQLASPQTKPIAVVFGLVGLYLCLEKKFTGRQAQKAHMQLAKRRKTWTMPPLPDARGSIRVGDVLAEPAGPARDAMIRRWCESVWEAYKESHAQVAQLLATELDIAPN
jgi:hypothetical protein